jgi:hypothetical protein
MAKKAEPKPDLSNVVTDASIEADVALTKEADLRKQLEDLKEIHATPDMPSRLPKRWGENKRLTFATPGTLQRDPFYIPEFVETKTSGVRRRVSVHRYINGQLHILTPDGRAKYRWTSVGKIGIQKRYGFRFSPYDGMFDGSGLFEKRDNRVWNGDVVLMYIGLDGWEDQRKRVRELNAYLEGSYGSDFFQTAQDTGTPSFVDDENRGVREFMT